jgi:hypothetical protein
MSQRACGRSRCAISLLSSMRLMPSSISVQRSLYTYFFYCGYEDKVLDYFVFEALLVTWEACGNPSYWIAFRFEGADQVLLLL